MCICAFVCVRMCVVCVCDSRVKKNIPCVHSVQRESDGGYRGGVWCAGCLTTSGTVWRETKGAHSAPDNLGMSRILGCSLFRFLLSLRRSHHHLCQSRPPPVLQAD